MANQRDDMDDRQQEEWYLLELDYEYEKWLEQQAEEMGSK